jgi:hypothetical protein
MKSIGQIQAFLGNGDQHVCADRDPDLRLDRVLVGAIKRLDAQVLLDPFGKQFDLPALAIKVRNLLGFEGEVFGLNVMRLPVSSLTTTRVSEAG